MNTQLIPSHLKILDKLRGFAAIYVLVGHSRWLLWEGYNEGFLLHPQIYSGADKIMMYAFSIFKYGHEAVIFFFVLSGFVIHWSTNNQILKQNGRFDVKLFLLKRIRRIYPPLIAAIIITYIIDYLGSNLLSYNIYSSGTPYTSINNVIQPNHSLTTFLGNLAFLQKIYVPVWGTNGPLWSLAFEWWFYMLYIPTLFAFKKNKIVTSLTILTVWVINAQFNIGPYLLSTVLGYFLSWFLGMLLADSLQNKSQSLRHFGSFLILVAILSLKYREYNFADHTLLSILIVTLFFALLTSERLGFLTRIPSGSSFSYTLYVIHFPIICLFAGHVMKINNGVLPHHFGYVIAAILISVGISWLTHFITEVPFIQGRTTTNSLISKTADADN